MPAALTWPELTRRLQRDLEARAAGEDAYRDDAAWQEVEGHVRKYARLMARHLRSANSEDELVQDIMVRLQSPHMLRRMTLAGSPGGYLFVIVKHHAVDLARRRQREHALIGTLLKDPSSVEVPEDTDAAWRLDALRQELRRLTPDERNLLRLRFWKGMAIGEIARQQSAPYSRVAVRIFRLLRRLRTRLGRESQEP